MQKKNKKGGFTPFEVVRTSASGGKAQLQTGFTLIEILVVIGIIAILATIVLIAINPARQFAQANNTQRTSNVNAILNAVGQYIADNKGTIPPGGIIAVPTVIKSGVGNADICSALVPQYLPSLPVDPRNASGPVAPPCTAPYDTQYSIDQDPNGRITVSAVGESVGGVVPTISVTR